MSSELFAGFPEKSEVIPVPTLFLNSVMPLIDDVAELKTVLHIFRLLSKKRGYPRFVTFTELFNDNCLKRSIAPKDTESFDSALRSALDMGLQHSILLQIELRKDARSENLYFLNNETGKKTIEKIKLGEIVLSDFTPVNHIEEQPVKISNIFSLYEQNIGILTPIIAEELQEAERLYPSDWVESAFREAVSVNKRSWRYVSRILERWAVEGKFDGKIGRNNKKENDPDRYVKGKYGHMVKR